MDKKLIMGNAAAAYGALAAGVNLISGYPGTPSSELLETASAFVKETVAEGMLKGSEAPHIEWSVNEKAALELAYGASLSGARALVTMKQVGLNVAADPLMTIAYLGVKGGLVLYVADDPGPISSQNEQDTRQFAQFAKVPVLDAATPLELHEMMQDAFELSEQHTTPVIVRATTRVCHGSAPVGILDGYVPHTITGFEKDPGWVIFPPLAYKAHAHMPERFAAIVADKRFSSRNYVQLAQEEQQGQQEQAALSETLRANALPEGLSFENRGIVAGGISWAYLQDALASLGLAGSIDLLKVGAPFPFDDELAAEFLSQHQHVIVFEELEATIERELLRVAGARHITVDIAGKLTGNTAYAGENSVELISAELLRFFGSTFVEEARQAADPGLLIPRPPVLCAGCPHRASFYAVKKALKRKRATYSGDIGCYTLGNALPLEMTDTCVCMGAGFTVPQGMYWAEPDVPHLGFVGDSTFFASGITGVVNAVYNQAPVTLIVLDNSLTAMTGSQPHPGTGIRMSYDATPADSKQALSIPRVLEALGIEHLAVVNPFEHEKAVAAVKEAIEAPGVKAIVFKAPCINVAERKPVPSVDAAACTACHICIDSIGCPALVMDEEDAVITLDNELCYGCDLCVPVCPFGALVSNA